MILKTMRKRKNLKKNNKIVVPKYKNAKVEFVRTSFTRTSFMRTRFSKFFKNALQVKKVQKISNYKNQIVIRDSYLKLNLLECLENIGKIKRIRKTPKHIERVIKAKYVAWNYI